MMIEFLGTPGAGKSKLASVVIQLLQEWGLTAMSVADAIHLHAARTLWGSPVSSLVPESLQKAALWRAYSCSSLLYQLRFAIGNYALFRYVVKSQQGRPIPRQHRQLVRRHFARAMGHYQFLNGRMRPDEILVYDEGFTHRVTHLYVSELEQPNPDSIMQYLTLVPKSDLVILVCAPLSICVERVLTRGLRGRLSGRSKKEVTRFLANAEEVVNVSVRHLEDMGREIIEVDNGGHLDPCVVQLSEQLGVFRPLQLLRSYRA